MINQVHYRDNLQLLEHLPNGMIDLIYCDILYGTNRKFKQYNDIKSEKQIIYSFYRKRISEMHRVLSKTGSIYLQMDSRISHWVRDMMDSEFGYENFKNMILWPRESSKGAKAKSRHFCKNTDIILFYTKSENYTFHKQFKPYTDEYIKKYFKLDENGRLFTDTALGTRLNKKTIEELEAEDRIYTTRSGGKRYKKYLDELEGVAVGDYWGDIFPVNSMSHEKTGFDTQKPLELTDRIVLTSSNENDVVADFFCGSGPFLVSAKNKNRNYIGCDTSDEAIEISKRRLNEVK